MKSCLNQATLSQTDVETFVEASASAGFEGVEFRIEKLRAYAALNHRWSELRRLLEDHDIEPVCLNSFEDFSHVPATDFDAVLHRAREFATICGSTDCRMFVACPSSMPKNMTKTEALEMTVHGLGKIAQMSAENAVGVAFEPLAGRSTSTLEDAVKIVRAAGASNVGLIVDTFHCYLGRSTLDALKDFPLERVWAVHFNDAEEGSLETMTDEKRLLPGKGVIKLHEFSRFLGERGWEGWLSIELFRQEYWGRDPFEVAKESMDSLRPYL